MCGELNESQEIQLLKTQDYVGCSWEQLHFTKHLNTTYELY